MNDIQHLARAQDKDSTGILPLLSLDGAAPRLTPSPVCG